MTVSNHTANLYGVKIVHSVPVVADSPFDVTLGLFVDVGGTVTVTYSSGATDTLTLAAGMWHPMAVTNVASGGTASGIHAGY